ncbi:hypothetical protein [Methylocaldum szegediense]|uniref:hypothetical protein n=1 Tax=Methylocaldum szegediense TaxID=73780 RepID=UPI0012EC26AB|nr:hypothetical protein [Methylocaldum szegediense]
MSVQRFPGLRLSCQVPYRTTFCTFREPIPVDRTRDTLFEAVNSQLARDGYLAHGGPLLDASLISVPANTLPERNETSARSRRVQWTGSRPRAGSRTSDAAKTRKYGQSRSS